MKPIKIDHVTIAGDNLAMLEEQLAALGLPCQYGGLHSNGITHMSLLGFNDGSYLELISKAVPSQPSPLWDSYIEKNAGICAWAVETADILDETARIRSAGIKVVGPIYMSRRTPAGELAEWQLAFLGEQAPGVKLPFIIKDRVDRQLRIKPAEMMRDSELTGIAKVMIAVVDLTAAIAEFQRLYQLTAPKIITSARFSAQLAIFADAPIILAAPGQEKGWLADRLAIFGDVLCGMLIGSRAFTVTKDHFGITDIDESSGEMIGWLTNHGIAGSAIGFLKVD
jgi:hypothetical protein